MRIPKHPTLVKRFIEARVKKLRAERPVLVASLVRIARSCGRQGCRCQRGEKHVSDYLTLKVAGKTKTVYVPADLKEEVQTSILEHRRLKRLLREITELQLALIRLHRTEQQRRGGRQ